MLHYVCNTSGLCDSMRKMSGQKTWLWFHKIVCHVFSGYTKPICLKKETTPFPNCVRWLTRNQMHPTMSRHAYQATPKTKALSDDAGFSHTDLNLEVQCLLKTCWNVSIARSEPKTTKELIRQKLELVKSFCKLKPYREWILPVKVETERVALPTAQQQTSCSESQEKHHRRLRFLMKYSTLPSPVFLLT